MRQLLQPPVVPPPQLIRQQKAQLQGGPGQLGAGQPQQQRAKAAGAAVAATLAASSTDAARCNQRHCQEAGAAGLRRRSRGDV